MPSGELREVFRRALECVRPYLQMSASDIAATVAASTSTSTSADRMNSTSPVTLGDMQKLHFYGYFKQVRTDTLSP